MIKISIQKKLKMADGITMLAIDTEIADGEFIAVFGKSGAGKTSLLRMIAGFMQPEKGIIEVNGKTWLNTERKINLPVQRRRTGFVFQDFSLFPNMNVRENLLYALRGNKDKDFVDSLLKMADMQRLADRKPGTLSGGQQQRVAMIRALAGKPDLLLLDEPFSALDVEMRDHLRNELQSLHKEFNLTTLLVTHDITDIYRLADKVISIDKGRIAKAGRPDEVFAGAHISGKVQLQGEVLRIRKSGVVYIVEILTGNTIIKVIADTEDVENLQAGSKVMVFSKAFNPIIRVL